MNFNSNFISYRNLPGQDPVTLITLYGEWNALFHQGHTARTKNLQGQLSNEIEKNFTHRRKLRGVALAIQTVIHLNNIIKRKKSEIRQSRTSPEFKNASATQQNQYSLHLEERPVVRKRSATFEESSSFDREDSDEDDEAPASFPNSPVRRASLSSRIPRAKPTTPSQHIAEIRKSISISSKTVDTKTHHSKCKSVSKNHTHQSRVDQFNAVGVAYQNVFGEADYDMADRRPQTVTLRNRPSSAKESTKRLSAPVPESVYHAYSLPSSPKHGMISGLAPGVRKRVPLSKCISVDGTAQRKHSATTPPIVQCNAAPPNFALRSSVNGPKKSPYRASYPSRNLASALMESLSVKPRGQRRGSLPLEEHVKPEKRERPSSERATGHVRRDLHVRKRLPKASTTDADVQVQQTLQETKQTVENIARISHIETLTSHPIGAVNETVEDKEDSADISIVKKTNKTENIKIHLGKTIDKSVEKSTTVSVTIDREKKQQATSVNQVSQQPYGLGRSLLTKVKQLAEEIETLAMLTTPDDAESPDNESKQSFPHACSTPVFTSRNIGNHDHLDENVASYPMARESAITQRPLWDQDTYSETEYLSINMRSPRNGNSPSIEEQ